MQNERNTGTGRLSDLDARAIGSAWSGLERGLARERGVGGWLRRRSFAVRAALAFGVAVAMPALAATLMVRPDLNAIRRDRAVIEVAVMLVIAVSAAVVGVWPVHRRPLPGWLIAAVVVSALIAAVLLTMIPLGTDVASDASCALTCGMLGMLAIVPAWTAARVVSRGAEGASLGAVTLAGTSAFFVLRASCPGDSLVHGLTGHIGPIIIVAMVALAAANWSTRHQRAATNAR